MNVSFKWDSNGLARISHQAATSDFTVNDLNSGTVAAQMDINVTAVPTDLTPTSDPAATDTSSSSGALSPAWLLALVLAGLSRRKRR